MDLMVKASAVALITVILCAMLSSQGKETALVLGIGVCCMLCLGTIRYLQPVVAFLDELEQVGELDAELVSPLLKAAGIGFLSETAALICEDAGNKSLGKSLQLLGSAGILWLSVPLFRNLLELIQRMMGEI